MVRNRIHQVMFGVVPVLLLASGCAHKYENPITKDTQQPDKVLFDTSVDDIEHGRYERARLTLQTMMNTYDTSEYLAKAKLAMADSWKREGGAHGMAQAEAEYKDFILFYPNMEESAEAQYKICEMQYLQMDKADRDNVHARLGDAECKDVLQKWPNSKYATAAGDMLRKIQEDLAAGEDNVAHFYAKKGGNGFASSANRATTAVDTYPLYSNADGLLWLAADDFNQMGDKYENQQAAMYTRIVRDYPMSIHAEESKVQLKAMGRPVPDADPVMEARMKFELENRTKPGFLTKALIPFSDRPDTHAAAKSGNPTMDTFKPGMPPNVPESARGGEAGLESRVTIGQPNRDILDKAPDARATTSTTPPAAGDAATDKSATPAGATTTATPAAPAATPAQETKPGEGSIAVTAAGAQAKMIAAKKAKPQKPVAIKRRPKPSDRKSTAPAPDATTPALTPAAIAAYRSCKDPRQRRRWSASAPTMSRILLVDDSPHAQRMGERILSDEGFEVVTVSNADSALIRLDDVDPDVVLADTVMPGRTGYEICQYLKMSPRHRYVRVILTAGVLEAFDEERARQVSADGTLKKPFEASALVAAVKPLAEGGHAEIALPG